MLNCPAFQLMSSSSRNAASLARRPNLAGTEKVKPLYDQFEAFGRVVGPDNLAVWFWTENIWETKSYKAVDTNRAAMFCEKLRLPPSNSPHILFTNEYPGTGLTNDASTFLLTTAKYSQHWSLNDRSPDEIMQLLTRVADKIVADKLSELDSTSGGLFARLAASLRGSSWLPGQSPDDCDHQGSARGRAVQVMELLSA